MSEDGQREPGSDGSAHRGRPGAKRARQDPGGQGPPGDGQDHVGTPRPDALIPALDEGQLAALRQIGREWDQVVRSPAGVAAGAAGRPVPGRVPRGRRGPPGPVHPVRARRGSRRAAAADPDHERFGDAAHAAGPGRADTEAAGLRPAAGRQRDRGGADAQARGAARAVGRRAILGRLRAPGDAGRPGPGRPARAVVLAAGRRGDRGLDAGRRGLLPADDPGLPARRRVLHRRERGTGPCPWPDGRRGPADRLRHDRRGLDRLRRGGHHLGVPVDAAGDRVDRRGRDRDPAGREPARGPPGGGYVRRADVRLHRGDRRPGGRGAGARRRPRVPPRPGPPPGHHAVP